MAVSSDGAPVGGRSYDAAEGLVAAATVRRPTLEDVFVAKTGQTFVRPPVTT